MDSGDGAVARDPRARLRRREQPVEGVPGAVQVGRARTGGALRDATGAQLQADFTPVRRGRDPLISRVATRGYSRATLVKFTTDAETAALRAGLREAFAYFGGVPEHVLFDNAKSVVIDREAYGEGLPRWNDAMKELAETCGFKPRLCRPYRAKTKGKVERFNASLKGSFIVPLAATIEAGGLRREVDVANTQVRRWLDEVANARVPATTHAVLAIRLIEERAVMLPPPPLMAHPMIPQRVALPIERLQHPLAVYDELLEVFA